MPLHQQQRLTKKQKRVQRQQGDVTVQDQRQPFNMKDGISPMTENQKVAFEYWDQGYNLMLHGIAGTGKTFLGLYFALKEVVRPNSPYKKVYIVRSTVSTRDQGFLPGSLKEKAKVFESPYVPICTKL